MDVSVELLGKTDLVVPAAAVHAVDYPADVEVLEPLTWDVPLAGSPAKLAELPDDLREFAFLLRERLMLMAEESPTYSPPNRSNARPPFTLNTQPAMTMNEVTSVIRQMQGGTFSLVNPQDQITYSITSSSLEEITLDEAGDMNEMVFKVSEGALDELMNAEDNTPESIGFRVSSVTLRQLAEANDGRAPESLSFAISPNDLMRLKQADPDPLGAPREDDEFTLFEVTATDLESMDLSRRGIPWESFNYRIFAEPDGTNANTMRLARKGPTEQNTVTFDDILEENQRYVVTTYVSTAEASELSDSTDQYPAWIADRYLQLPETLPRRVRELANNIVEDADAETPWEKTMAIKEFLQDQVYSLEIEGPGPFDDGIEYFLFNTINEPCPSDYPDCDVSKRKGYSQYYGSAGTVLLRSVGVPARMIAGWSAGEYIPDQGQFLIRDRNRHGWTQIYAPPYGWIDIEVTPGRATVPRNVLVPTTPTSDIPPGLIGSAEFDPDYLEYLEDLDELALLAQDLVRSNRTTSEPGQSDQGFSIDIPVIPTALAAVAIGLIVGLIVVWRWNLRGQPEAVRAYSQFVRSASLLGYRRPSHASAREFVDEIGDMTLRYTDARLIIDAFEQAVYGPRQTVPSSDASETPNVEPDDETSQADNPEAAARQLGKAWRSLARAMLKHRIMSIFGMTPTYVSDEPQERTRFAS